MSIRKARVAACYLGRVRPLPAAVALVLMGCVADLTIDVPGTDDTSGDERRDPVAEPTGASPAAPPAGPEPNPAVHTTDPGCAECYRDHRTCIDEARKRPVAGDMGACVAHRDACLLERGC
jgi:hypothetical protein